MRRIISLLMENEPGSLSRVVGVFSQRWYNIDTMTVCPTEDKTMTRITITTHGDDKIIEKITKQLNRLIDVIKVVDLTENPHIERELMLIKLNAASSRHRDEIIRCTEIFRGHVIDVITDAYVIQIAGASDKLDAYIDSIKHFGIIEVVRSGITGIARGNKGLTVTKNEIHLSKETN